MILDLTFEGRVPYERRLQLLDAASWRLLDWSVRNQDELLSRELIASDPLNELAAARRRVEKAFNEIDEREAFDIDARFYDSFRDSRRRGLFPVLVRQRFNIARLADSDRYGLPASALAMAASGIAPYTLQQISTTNPLTARAAFGGALGLMVGIAVLYATVKEVEGADHMRGVCEKIADHYGAELDKAKINKDRIHELGGMTATCINSSLFQATPLKAELELPAK